MSVAVAIPMLDEWQNVPRLINSLRSQRYQQFCVYVCVNQPDAWWCEDKDSEHYKVCLRNAETMAFLHQVKDIRVEVIDCSSPGKGWQGKRKGVGWARKLLMDRIVQQAGNGGIIISMDADTDFDEYYFQSVVDTFSLLRGCNALAVPYYHKLPADEDAARQMLYYECYMRHYHLSLLKINSPYAFTALGSAMAFTTAAYSRVGGITPLQGGEDFYLLQKFVKTSSLYLSAAGDYASHAVVFPSCRVSYRVPFGTGPAVALSLKELQSKYPFYSQRAFEDVRQTCALFPRLFQADVDTPMTAFLAEQLKTDDLWSSLRKNFKSSDKFVHACYERVDGLRILQYLRHAGYPSDKPIYNGTPLDFEWDAISLLDDYRNALCERERQLSPSFLSAVNVFAKGKSQYDM